MLSGAIYCEQPARWMLKSYEASVDCSQDGSLKHCELFSRPPMNISIEQRIVARDAMQHRNWMACIWSWVATSAGDRAVWLCRHHRHLPPVHQPDVAAGQLPSRDLSGHHLCPQRLWLAGLDCSHSDDGGPIHSDGNCRFHGCVLGTAVATLGLLRQYLARYYAVRRYFIRLVKKAGRSPGAASWAGGSLWCRLASL